MQKRGWLTYLAPEAWLELRCPDRTPRGHMISLDREPLGQQRFRVHFRSIDSDEIYFEVASYQDLSTQDAFLQLKNSEMARYRELEVSELVPSASVAQPAHQFTMRWPDRERLVTFIQRDHLLHRVIFDPRSELNWTMLQLMRFADQDRRTAAGKT